MTRYAPSHTAFQYMGRIDFGNPDAPILYWAGSMIHFAVTGTKLTVFLENHRCYNGMQFGCWIDGKEHVIALTEESGTQGYVLPLDGDDEHMVTLYKRQDNPHYITFHGIETNGELTALPPLPARRMECFGDSVSAGSVVEAVDHIGQLDPEVYTSEYDNAWHSYAMQTARLLGAQMHLTAQGGIALLDHTGYFDNGKYGMVSVYDKLCYLSYAPEMTPWDFSRYTPHVVLFAIGQNDQRIGDEDNCIHTPEQRAHWLERYCALIGDLMERYPKATFVLLLTVLMHGEYWEELLDAACARLGSPRVVRFRFRRSGKATPGHPRIPEQCEMACELTEFLQSYGDLIWAD